MAKTDLDVFWKSREAYDTHDWEGKLLLHSWLLDLGVMMSEPAIRFNGMAGECLWGCACWVVVVPYDQMRGDTLPPADRTSILAEGIGHDDQDGCSNAVIQAHAGEGLVMEEAAEQSGGRIPVTVVTGFLGSGKTTLINRILSEQHGRNIAGNCE